MRTLFLTAKKHAIDNNAKRITSAHMRAAMFTVSFNDLEMQKLIFGYFGITSPPRLNFLDKSINLEDTKKHPKINFTPEVKKFKIYLEDLGISYARELCTVEVAKQIATAVQEVVGKEIPTVIKAKVKEPYIVNDLIRDANAMRESLTKKLYGQERAIETIADSIKNNILASTDSPKSTYLFLGPPATGKTYLAQLMGEHLSDYKIKKFDMTQYSHTDSGSALYGTSRMWGNVKPGALTSFVKANPKSIIILDEFEKANNQVQSNLLTIFEGGYLQDACGWCGDTPWGAKGPLSNEEEKCSEDEIEDIVDFKQTIFVITSNLGKELYSDHKFLELVSDDYIQAESMILDALRREEKQNTQGGGTEVAIVPELVSRFSKANVVLFNKLTFQANESIANNAFNEYQKSFAKQFGITLNLDENYKNFLKTQILSFAPELDARRLQSKIGIQFFDKVTDYVMQQNKDTSSFREIKIHISKEVNDFLHSKIDQNIEDQTLIRELFRKNLTLELEEVFTSNGAVITYFIKSCHFKRVQRIKDFSEDGLVFDIPEVSFSDIAGHEKAKTRLAEAINFLKEPSLMEHFDIDAPKGMLLYGPPGTGKTLLAKAFAHEADLPFIATTGTDLLDPAKTKTIFAKAKEYAPSIVFIDEIDALGKRGKNDGREIAINKLLSELDGFSADPDENVFVIAATNFKEHIDSALIRPGRIELHIEIDALDKVARRYFIDKILTTKPVEGDFDTEKLLVYTAGMTGAQLEMMGKEASIYCIRHGLKAITQQILIEEINTIKYGSRITHRSIDKLMQSTAIHEAGHAVISRVLMPEVKIEQITVVPRANALGFVSYDRDKNYDSLTREDIKNKLCVAFAGREAQLKEYGEDGFDSGASNDLSMATKYAHHAIATLGMGEHTGYINVSGFNEDKLFKKEIEAELKLWLDEAKERTKKLIDENWSKVTTLAVLLQEEEIVTEDELLELMA